MVRQLVAVVARAALQWALSTLLLANGAAFCLIAAAATWLRLTPPCLLCAGVHRLLGEERDSDSFRRLLCHAHVAAVVAASAAPELEEEKKVESREKRGEAEDGNSEKLAGMEAHRVVSIGSEICEQDNAGDHRLVTAATTCNAVNDGDGDGDNDPYVSLFELAPIVARAPQSDGGHGHGHDLLDEMPHDPRRDDGAPPTVPHLVAALRAQRRELDALREDLAVARRAAAEHQRQTEEQGEFNREAVRLAMQLVHEAEKEKHALQREVDACRVKAELFDAMDHHNAASPPFPSNGSGAGGDNNNYQSLVDFLPGSVFSSSPDLANLLKLYTDGNGGRRMADAAASTVPVVDEEDGKEEEEEEEVVVAGIGGVDSNGNGDDTGNTIAIADDSNLQERGGDKLESTEVSPVR
uniref:GTD-binding domain-containing protein n=1 Tax=Leersia perrieri TaxID=77586 RepID=A0A0D9XZC3_9ORYZ